jgi:hypothetical protein
MERVLQVMLDFGERALNSPEAEPGSVEPIQTHFGLRGSAESIQGQDAGAERIGSEARSMLEQTGVRAGRVCPIRFIGIHRRSHSRMAAAPGWLPGWVPSVIGLCPVWGKSRHGPAG